MSRITGTITAGMLAMVMAACGSATKTPPTTAPATPAAAPAQPPPQPAQPAAQPSAQPPAPAQQQPAAGGAQPAAGSGQPEAGGGAPAAGGGRGRGNPPPPPPTPPKVLPKPVTPIVSATAPSPDPRVGLKAGWWDAGQAAWNMNLISSTPPSEVSLGKTAQGRVIKWGDAEVRIPTHSDLAFTGKYTVQGNYNGFEIYDISNPEEPALAQRYDCPASQNDVSVYKNLLFMSAEATNSRADCAFAGRPDQVRKDRVRRIRIFDISNMKTARLVTTVQTCRGSHTHTVVTQPGDNDNVYIYVSGTSSVRSADELPGCQDGSVTDNPNTARFRLEVIKVPLAAPQTAAIVSSPRIFNALPVAPRNPERDAVSGRGGGGGAGGAQGAGGAPGAPGAPGAQQAAGGGRGRGNQGPPTGPNQCHDITVYPEIGLAGGACAGLGLLLDIRDVAHPQRIDFAADANMS